MPTIVTHGDAALDQDERLKRRRERRELRQIRGRGGSRPGRTESMGAAGALGVRSPLGVDPDGSMPTTDADMSTTSMSRPRSPRRSPEASEESVMSNRRRRRRELRMRTRERNAATAAGAGGSIPGDFDDDGGGVGGGGGGRHRRRPHEGDAGDDGDSVRLEVDGSDGRRRRDHERVDAARTPTTADGTESPPPMHPVDFEDMKRVRRRLEQERKAELMREINQALQNGDRTGAAPGALDDATLLEEEAIRKRRERKEARRAKRQSMLRRAEAASADSVDDDNDLVAEVEVDPVRLLRVALFFFILFFFIFFLYFAAVCTL